MSLGSIEHYVVDEDDDLNDDDIPGFSHPALATATIPDKGKSRAQPEPEQLAPPSSRLGPAVSGNIGSSSQTTSRPANRQTLGGLQVETRCVLFVYEKNEMAYVQGARFSTADTLDEPIVKTIVRFSVSLDGLIILNYHSIGPRFVLHLLQTCSSSVSSTHKRPWSSQVSLWTRMWRWFLINFHD